MTHEIEEVGYPALNAGWRKARDDLLTLAVALGVAALIVVSQLIVARHDDHVHQDA